MFFFHPMWDHESQRIGMQKCTPSGYAIHGIGELIGFIGLLLLLVALASLAYEGIAGTFHASLLWMLAVPFSLGVVSEALVQYSWLLARRKGFHYDYEQCEASWMEAGQRRTYKWTA